MTRSVSPTTLRSTRSIGPNSTNSLETKPRLLGKSRKYSNRHSVRMDHNEDGATARCVGKSTNTATAVAFGWIRTRMPELRDLAVGTTATAEGPCEWAHLRWTRASHRWARHLAWDCGDWHLTGTLLHAADRRTMQVRKPFGRDLHTDGHSHTPESGRDICIESNWRRVGIGRSSLSMSPILPSRPRTGQ